MSDLREALLERIQDWRAADVRFVGRHMARAYSNAADDIERVLAAHPETDGGAAGPPAVAAAAAEATPPAAPSSLDRDAVAKVLAEHRIECTGLGEVTCWGCRDRSWMATSEYRSHLADAVVALARPVNEVRAAWVADQAPAVERGYEAVYGVIRAQNQSERPSTVEVNALVWRCVAAFLESLRDDAAGAGS